MKYFWLIMLLLSAPVVVAQQTLNGVVVDKETTQPLTNVTVLDLQSNKWTITSDKGEFALLVNGKSEVTLSFRLLGKQEVVRVIAKSDLSKSILVEMTDQNLRIDEVVVNAKKGNRYSEIKLTREAISQVQSFSLNEVLEQLPDQATTNFDLSEFKPIAFRTSRPSSVGASSGGFNTGFGNKSFGTSVVVDGIPISNNENMQSYSGNNSAPFSPNYLGFGESGSYDFNGYVSNANYGVDLREINTENIENIEVVQGIPSARYGDLTSGLIKIQQRAGKSPFKLTASIREGAQQYGFFKGFRLGERAGDLNVNISYLKSNTNPRTSFMLYERVNTNLMWSWSNASKNIRNSFSVDYGFNNDDFNFEEEDTDHKILQNKKKDLSVSNRFKWNFSDWFFDNLDINANFRYSDHYTFESKFVNNGGAVVGTSTSEGVYEATYTLPSYTSVKAVEGKPISSFASADFYKSFASGLWNHNLLVGFSGRTSDNKGRGRLGAPETMASNAIGGGGGASNFRPYNFGENIRAEYQISTYVEDNITREWEKSVYNLNAGLRYDNMYGFSTLAPRLNSYFIYDNFKIRGGFGLTSKAPSLNQIYTGPRFYDAILGDYRYPGYYNVSIVQTFVDQEDNKDLQPSKSLRSELGFDVKLPFAEINVTAFYNHLYDGITAETYAIKRDLASIAMQFDGVNKPSFDITGYTPFYFTQSRLVNKMESTDKGIEFFVDLNKVMPKNISLGFNGSYIETINFNGVDSYYRSTNANLEEKYGVMAPYNSYQKLFRMGGNISYHLPKIGLVVAVRSEHFLVEDSWYNYENIPYAYIDSNLQKHIIPEADRGNTALYGHITGNAGLVDRGLDQVYHNLNLRITKDFFNGLRFSFYANNFLDLKQTSTEYLNGQYVKMIKPSMPNLSFGTQIEYQF